MVKARACILFRFSADIDEYASLQDWVQTVMQALSHPHNPYNKKIEVVHTEELSPLNVLSDELNAISPDLARWARTQATAEQALTKLRSIIEKAA